MHTYFLLDRSGSMVSNWEEVIESINTYVREMAGDEHLINSRITVACFDSVDPFLLVRRNKKIKKWKDISCDEITPRGMTPLYDGIGQLSLTIKKDNPDRAAIIILTDGMENSSREFDKKSAKKIIDGFKKKNFDVNFLGVNFDAFSEADNVGVTSSFTLNTTIGNYADTMIRMVSKNSMYAVTGTVRGFSDDEREEASK